MMIRDMCPVPTSDLPGSCPPPPPPWPRPRLLISNQALESQSVTLPPRGGPRGGPRVRGTAVRGTGVRTRSPSPLPLQIRHHRLAASGEGGDLGKNRFYVAKTHHVVIGIHWLCGGYQRVQVVMWYT
jgi:hypothetical protein